MISPAVLSIEARKLRKSYKSTRVLDDIDLRVEPGEFVSLLGPSGSGKTTLLMVLAGFVLPDDGALFFGDEPVAGKPAHKRNLGVVFQHHALFPHMSVLENVAFPLSLRRVPRAEITVRVGEALDLVRLKGFEERRVSQLSGGQSQRVALARAIVFRPGILLMDEPLSALDRQLRDEMQAEILTLHEKLGQTTVYVTHDQREALTMSDRVAVLDRGRILQIDTPQRLYERPVNRFVAQFVGETNCVPVHAKDGALWFGSRRLALSPPPGGGDYVLVVRAEHFQLKPVSEAPGPMLCFEGRLIRSVFQGDAILSHVRLEDGTEVRVRGGTEGAPLRAGEPVSCRVDPRGVVVLPADGGA